MTRPPRPRSTTSRTYRTWRRGAPLALLGVLAWAAAIALWVFWLPTQRQQLASLREARESAVSLSARGGARVPQRATNASASATFRAAFPGLESRPGRLESLLAAATRRSLVWQRSEFRTSREGLPGLVRYRITLPLSGRYEALRAFVDEALLDDPALGLDRLLLRRSAPNAQQVEIESVWSLYTRDTTSVHVENTSVSAPR